MAGEILGQAGVSTRNLGGQTKRVLALGLELRIGAGVWGRHGLPFGALCPCLGLTWCQRGSLSGM